jgi:hypothetical protein
MDDVFSKQEAEAAIEDLRSGVPPEARISVWLLVGRDRLLREATADLDAVAKGDFRTRLLLGEYGSGKSHFLGVLQYLAYARGFAVAVCAQDLASGAVANRPDLLYERIVQSLSLSPGNRDGLGTLLSKWAEHVMPIASNLSLSVYRALRLAELGKLPPKEVIPRRTTLALTGYLLAAQVGNDEIRRQMAQGLKDIKIENRQLVALAEKVGFIKSYVGFTPSKYDGMFFFQQLNVLSHMLRVIGYQGTVLLLDEMESVAELRLSISRQKAYRILHALLFNSYDATGLYAVFAFTPGFVAQLTADEDLTGGKYQADWQRLWKENQWELPPIDDHQARTLLEKVAVLHGTAFDWDAMAALGGGIQRIIQRWSKGGRNIRELVRMGVSFLDSAESSHQVT